MTDYEKRWRAETARIKPKVQFMPDPDDSTKATIVVQVPLNAVRRYSSITTRLHYVDTRLRRRGPV